MRIACVDRSAADRVKLKKRIDDAYDQCRDTVGHLPSLAPYPASREEILLNSAPAIAILGPKLSTEEAYSICRELRQSFPNTAIFLDLEKGSYGLRTLRRFEGICRGVFSPDDPASRIVHCLASAEIETARRKPGRLVTISGSKGGVGTTSIASGVAEAAVASNQSAVLVDLSPSGSLLHYLGATRWQSADYASALTDGIMPDKKLVESCLCELPNGLSVLLPPSGGSEVRELWLRSPERFEISLSFIDLLCDQFDLVLVDISSAEGVLPFALQSRALTSLIVTSNDPASVHLLHRKLSVLTESPGHSEVVILCNLLIPQGLNQNDIIDFLYINDNFEHSMCPFQPIEFDPRGQTWIGTGNGFYAECAKANRSTFQIIADSVCEKSLTSTPTEYREPKLIAHLKNAFQKSFSRKSTKSRNRLLPSPEEASKPEPLQKENWQFGNSINKPQSKPKDPDLEFTTNGNGSLNGHAKLYESPKVVNSSN